MFHSGTAVRTAFDQLGLEFIALAESLEPADLDRPGLGEWDVAETLAHAIGAFRSAATALDALVSVDHVLQGAGAFYRAALSSPNLHAMIAARARVDATDLRHDVVAAVRFTVENACARVGTAGDDAIVATAFGQMKLIPFLMTRVVEAGVHYLDLGAALGLPLTVPQATAEIIVATLIEGTDASLVIRALTGRAALPAGFNVLQ